MRKIWLPILALVFLFMISSPASAQFSLKNQSKATFSGQIVDARTGSPLVDALIIVRTQYQDYKGKTDNTGNFVFEVDDKDGLKNFVLLASHPDYREKDVSGILNNGFGGSKAKFSLQGSGDSSSATLKHKKSEFSLTCGKDAQIGTKDGRLITGQLECLQGERVFTVGLSRGDSFAIRGSSDISVEVNGDKTKIESSQEQPIQITVKVLMFKR